MFALLAALGAGIGGGVACAGPDGAAAPGFTGACAAASVPARTADPCGKKTLELDRQRRNQASPRMLQDTLAEQHKTPLNTRKNSTWAVSHSRGPEPENPLAGRLCMVLYTC